MATHSLPPEVRGALTALGKEFEQLHLTFGRATASLCSYWLADDPRADIDEGYSELFWKWAARYPAIEHFRCLVTQHQPPSSFRAYFDFYIEMIAEGVRPIFAELIEIGVKHEIDGIAWAKLQAEQLIKNYRHSVIDWISVASDKQAYRNSWQAPAFLTMKPSGNRPYDPERAWAWERIDATSTVELLNAFANEYAQRLGDAIEEEAGKAYREAVKRSRPVVTTIDGKPSKERELEAQKSQEDPEAERQALIEWVKHTLAKRCRNDRTASIFRVDERTIRNWIDEGKLDPAGKRHATVESIRRLMAIRLPERV